LKWINLTENGIQLPALLNAVTNLWVPKKGISWVDERLLTLKTQATVLHITY